MRSVFLSLGFAAWVNAAPMAAQAELPTLGPDAAPVLAGAASESTGTLTLAAAFELAAATSPEIGRARRELAAAEARITQARTRPNPVLSAAREELRSDAPQTTFELSQELELGGKRAARIEAAEGGRAVAAADLADATAQLRAAVTTAFFDVLIAQERLELAEATAALARRATGAATARVTAGRESPVAETRAQVAEAGVQVELAQAASDLDVARRQLAVLWNSPEPVFSEAAGEVDALPTVPMLAELSARLGDSAPLIRARREIERREAMLRVERSRRIQNVTISVGTQRSDAFESDQYLVGVSVPLPLFDRNQGNIAEAQQRLYLAQEDQTATEVRLRTTLAQAYGRWGTSRRQMETLRDNVLPGARRAFDATTRGFEMGKFNFLDVLDAQRTLFQARSQYLSALSQTYGAIAELQRILGDAALATPSPPAR